MLRDFLNFLVVFNPFLGIFRHFCVVCRGVKLSILSIFKNKWPSILSIFSRFFIRFMIDFSINFFVCAAILCQNFRLRRNFVPKFSTAPQFCAKIFGCAAILCQNFRLRRYFVPKFSAAPLFCAKIFDCAAILCQNFWLRRYFVSKFSAAPLFCAKILWPIDEWPSEARPGYELVFWTTIFIRAYSIFV